MLAQLLGVRMILWAGQLIPRPVPPDVLAAVTKVDVTNDARQGDGFQITVELSKDNPLDYSVMWSGTFDPMNRVVIALLIGASLEVLIDGVVTQHQLTPSEQPGQSTLTITGKDVTQVLDLDEKEASFPYQPDFLIVERLLLTYMKNGVLGPHTILPTSDVPLDILRRPQQHDTDLRYIQKLAQRNGYVFYIEPLTFGVTRAYFGPENRLGFPQAALTLNMGPHTNLKSVGFTNDVMAPVGAEGSFVEPISKMVIPIPAMPPLRIPLAPIPVFARRTTKLSQSANEGPLEAVASSMEAATTAPEAISGQGEIDTIRYGRVLRARGLVGMRGVGFSYDGVYYVSRVAHSITLNNYTQTFALSRDGLGSITPVLPT